LRVRRRCWHCYRGVDAVMDRRHFLYSSGALVATTIAGGMLWRLRPPPREEGFITGASNNSYVLYDLMKREAMIVDGPNRSHSFLVWPHQAQSVLAIEKRGTKMVLVDFARRRIEREIPVVEPRRYYGHARLSPDNQYLFSSQVDMNTGDGCVVV